MTIGNSSTPSLRAEATPRSSVTPIASATLAGAAAVRPTGTTGAATATAAGTDLKPYAAPRITSRLPLEARAGTPLFMEDFGNPRTGRTYDPHRPPVARPYGGR